MLFWLGQAVYSKKTDIGEKKGFLVSFLIFFADFKCAPSRNDVLQQVEPTTILITMSLFNDMPEDNVPEDNVPEDNVPEDNVPEVKRKLTTRY